MRRQRSDRRKRGTNPDESKTEGNKKQTKRRRKVEQKAEPSQTKMK
jgi:hypothetical protein